MLWVLRMLGLYLLDVARLIVFTVTVGTVAGIVAGLLWG
jgi:hypothetical protein